MRAMVNRVLKNMDLHKFSFVRVSRGTNAIGSLIFEFVVFFYASAACKLYSVWVWVNYSAAYGDAYMSFANRVPNIELKLYRQLTRLEITHKQQTNMNIY